MSSIPDLLARLKIRKINQSSDVEIFLSDIHEIQEKTNEVFRVTAWPCIEQARKASWFGKTGALSGGREKTRSFRAEMNRAK